jgi:hypothetical protein
MTALECADAGHAGSCSAGRGHGKAAPKSSPLDDHQDPGDAGLFTLLAQAGEHARRALQFLAARTAVR